MSSTSDSMDLTSKVPSFEVFDSASAAEQAVQAWALESGFAATTKSSNNGIINLHCDRRVNPLIACAFLAEISCKEKAAMVSEQEQVLQEWHVNILNATHNHGPSPVDKHNGHRACDKETFMHLMVDPLIGEGCLTRSILEELHTSHTPGCANIQAKDIRTRRQNLRRRRKHRERQAEALEAYIWKQKILKEIEAMASEMHTRDRDATSA
ncbi:hypothetical protein N7510_011125 [Penicillium lagena]|uniref:uncharacterized protein n=1 Tax=Penicillium lagena TaxID=94218 RepID=UPI0025401FA7|nr:uncharacterized protein N7510_011125 [Penicillium lagena]KAJ5601591.1 hypothetical protein N7510_011125 [Penicillium lagena]